MSQTDSGSDDEENYHYDDDDDDTKPTVTYLDGQAGVDQAMVDDLFDNPQVPKIKKARYRYHHRHTSSSSAYYHHIIIVIIIIIIIKY